jgi:protein involved in sex pheromone biosynthesis
MKKTVIITLLAAGILSACSGTANKEASAPVETETSTSINQDSIQTELNKQAEMDRLAKEAKTADSLRQVKEHGHAH